MDCHQHSIAYWIRNHDSQGRITQGFFLPHLHKIMSIKGILMKCLWVNCSTSFIVQRMYGWMPHSPSIMTNFDGLDYLYQIQAQLKWGEFSKNITTSALQEQHERQSTTTTVLVNSYDTTSEDLYQLTMAMDMCYSAAVTITPCTKQLSSHMARVFEP